MTDLGRDCRRLGRGHLRTYDKAFAITAFGFEDGHNLFAGVDFLDDSEGIGIIGKLDANGNLDTNFGVEGFQPWPEVNGGGFHAMVRDERAYVAVGGCADRPCLVRFDTDGEADESFGQRGILSLPNPDGSVADLAVNAKGQYVAIGGNGEGDWLLTRVTRTGQILTATESFTTGEDRAEYVLPDVLGYLVLGTKKDSSADAHSFMPILVKYDLEFQREPGFGASGIAELLQDTTVKGGCGLARQADGRLIVAYTLRGAGTLVLKRIWN